MTGDPPVEVRGLTKRFGRVTAVDGLSFVVERGQVVGLLGPNGAGKTTTLRVLLGLVRPSGGEALLFGTPVRPGLPELRRVGALVEGPGFVPHLSGQRNLELYWEAGGRPLQEAQFDFALEVAGLGDALRRKVRTYSHGMRQRLGIAQALLGRPELLVLDEPVNGLDPAQIVEVRTVVLRLAASGVTVLLSSHILAEVEQTCTHAVVMQRGRLVAAGSVAELTATAESAYLEVDDPGRAAAILERLAGVRRVVSTPPGLTVELAGTDRASLVSALVEAGVRVSTVVAHRSLETAFLELTEGIRA